MTIAEILSLSPASPSPTVSQGVTPRSPSNSVVIPDVTWDQYSRLGDVFGERQVRVTFDRGTLEIMTLSLPHESFNSILAELVACLADELGLPRVNVGSTTFKKKELDAGLEPDNCFYLDSSPRIRGKRSLDLDVDPPPDLAIEIDISRSSLNRLGIYAGLKVREVWRFDGETLEVRRLIGDEYQLVESSPQFPCVPIAVLQAILRRSLDEDHGSLMREFRTWLRERIASNWQTDS